MQRTVRIVREIGITDIILVAPEEDPLNYSYEIEGASLYRKALPIEKEVFYRQADRYLPRSIWNMSGRTLFLPGDFYFCRSTLKGILTYDPDTWVFYARLSNTRWPEGAPLAIKRTRMILGFGFPPHEHDLVMKRIEEITAMQRDPNNPISRSLGLDIYRYMAGQSPDEVARKGSKGNDEGGKANWSNYPPHLWEPAESTADIDFDNPQTYGGFMLHYDPNLHD